MWPGLGRSGEDDTGRDMGSLARLGGGHGEKNTGRDMGCTLLGLHLFMI